MFSADAAGGDDGDALAAAQIGAVADGAVGREDRAAQHRRFGERKAVGQREDVGRRHHRVLGEAGHRVHRERRAVGAPQPRRAVVERAAQTVHREEVVAEIVAPDRAQPAAAARHDERARRPSCRRRARDAGPELDDRAGDLVAEHGRGRERDLRLHDVQVGVADAAGVHLDEHLAVERRRNRDLLDVQPARRALQHRGFHGVMSAKWRGLPYFLTFSTRSMSWCIVSVARMHGDDGDRGHARSGRATARRGRSRAAAALAAMIGESPPASTEESCTPSDAPL